MIKYINELTKKELAGKKILLRVDFDVPLTQQSAIGPSAKIQETFRVKAHKETLDYLIDAGAKVMLVSHLGHGVSDASFGPIVEEIGEISGHTITLVPHSGLDGIDGLFAVADVLLLDNMRQDKREVENNDELARSLSKDFDYYVNDDFATAHRKHASIVAVAKHLPSYAGFLIKKEIENLGQVMDAPAEGKVLVLGGAKISTKMPVIKNFIDKAEKILIGGALANDFFQARGIQIGKSVVDGSISPDVTSDKIILPHDMVISADKSGVSVPAISTVRDIGADEAILDIGPETAKEWTSIIKRAKMVIWNGPMGLFEVEKFGEGTRLVAHAVAGSTRSIIGGGDTIAAVDKLGLLDEYSFVSSGGGSMLEFLAGNKLPGLEALGYY